MKIRHQLFILILIPGISASLIISSVLFFQDKKNSHQQTYNTIEATTPTPSAEWKTPSKKDKKVVNENLFIPQNFLIAFNLLLITTSFISAYVIGRYLKRPVEELRKFTTKIKEGNVKSRVTDFPSNELGDLAITFNNMADMLENKINELDKLGYVLSHDLRAPLNNIIPLVTFLKEDNRGILNKESEEMLSMIESKAKQMNELILEIVHNTRREKKIKENISVHSLVNSILNEISLPDNIQVFIQQNLPVIEFHKSSLIQIYQILLHNAIKFMNKKPGKIKIGYSDEGNFHKFWVSDSGPGIPQKDFESMAELFAGTNNQPFINSTSMGLGRVKNIVEENKGKIWVESEPGIGSTFYFTIFHGITA